MGIVRRRRRRHRRSAADAAAPRRTAKVQIAILPCGLQFLGRVLQPQFQVVVLLRVLAIASVEQELRHHFGKFVALALEVRDLAVVAVVAVVDLGGWDEGGRWRGIRRGGDGGLLRRILPPSWRRRGRDEGEGDGGGGRSPVS